MELYITKSQVFAVITTTNARVFFTFFLTETSVLSLADANNRKKTRD
ncbi:hypothetical protein BTJ48_03915 [Bacillus mycoides]|nr:hypothetical protein BTJ48_03915 [Bacillus mycoides]